MATLCCYSMTLHDVDSENSANFLSHASAPEPPSADSSGARRADNSDDAIAVQCVKFVRGDADAL